METELKNRLQRLDTSKLMDVVKNYRQYGYSEEIRNYALDLLEAQGISKSDLQLTGNFENKNYDLANDVLLSFGKNSKFAFVFYSVLVVLKLYVLRSNSTNQFIGTVLTVGFILSFILYIYFLLRSFLNQSDFYKLTGDKYGSDGALVYLVFGMPFYVVMYFVFRNQMKERMKMIQ